MAKPISIPIATDTRDSAQAIQKGLISPLEDVVDSLDDVERNSDQLASELERQMRDAQAATERYNDAVKDAAHDADRAADDAVESTQDIGRAHEKLSSKIREEAQRSRKASGDEQRRTVVETNESMSEIKDEARSNLSEVVSSFDGSMQSVGDLAQGTLGGLVGSLGPLGIAVGAAGAVGIGLIIAEVEKAEERAAAMRERVGELAGELIDAGSVGRRSVESVVDELRDLAVQTDENELNLRKVREQSEELGVPFRELAQIYADTQGELDPLIEQTEQAIASERAYADQVTASAGIIPPAIQERINKLTDQATTLREVRDANAEAAQIEADWIAAGGPEMEAKAAATASFAQSIQDELTGAGAEWEEFANKEGGVNLDAYNGMLEEKAAAVTKYQENVVTASSSLNSEALAYISSLGVEAAPLLQAYIDAPLDQKQRTEENWATLGSAASSSYVTNLESAMPDAIDGPKITPVMPDAESTLSQFRRYYQDNPLRLPVQPYSAPGRDVG